MVDAIVKELNIRKNYLANEVVETIYFGGGTPSVLSIQQIELILEQVFSHFRVSDKPEITLEANPDDLNENILKALYNAGVNRLSIGIQSFNDEVLRWMNRAHTSKMALQSICQASEIGYKSINTDIIFGIPKTNKSYLEEQINTFTKLPIDHISAYQLTIESKTKFGHDFKKGQFEELEDDICVEQFYQVRQGLESKGFEPYEISNFAKNQSYSKHNSSYWKGVQYLGIGPGAHSFNGTSRQFNVSNNHKYMKSITNGSPYFENELLTKEMKQNEFLLTRLRTKWGVPLSSFKNEFGEAALVSLLETIEKNNLKKYVDIKNNVILLKKNSLIIADFVTGELFI